MHFILAIVHVSPFNSTTKLTISFQYIFIKISTQMLFGSKAKEHLYLGQRHHASS